MLLRSDFHAFPELISLHQFQAIIQGGYVHILFELYSVPPYLPDDEIEFPATLPVPILQVL